MIRKWSWRFTGTCLAFPHSFHCSIHPHKFKITTKQKSIASLPQYTRAYWSHCSTFRSRTQIHVCYGGQGLFDTWYVFSYISSSTHHNSHFLYAILFPACQEFWNMTVYSKKVKATNLKASASPPPSWPQKEKKELEECFKYLTLGHKDFPSIIVDRHGRIVLWYLPGILHPQRIVSSSLISPTMPL